MLIGTISDDWQAKVEEKGWCKFNAYNGHTIFRYRSRYYTKEILTGVMFGPFKSMSLAVTYARTHEAGTTIFNLYRF